jgi:hypothetical protein
MVGCLRPFIRISVEDSVGRRFAPSQTPLEAFEQLTQTISQR